MTGDGSAITVDLPTRLRVDIDRGLGSIQAFADQPRNRTVALITTTGAWTLVDPLFDYVDGQPDGWSSLTGDVLAAATQGTPANLSIRADDTAFPAPPTSAPNAGWPSAPESPSFWPPLLGLYGFGAAAAPRPDTNPRCSSQAMTER